jgi:hypothetical protein
MIAAVKFIPRLVSLGIVGLVLVSLNGKVTQAQRAEPNDGSIDLLSLGCSYSGQGKLITDERENISVDKQIFTPAFYFNYLDGDNNPSLLTCKLTPSEQPKTLQLMIGVQDYSADYEHEITFKVYLDGQETGFHLLSAGQGKILLFDVTKTNSVALEVKCSYGSYNYSCPPLYVLKASILPSPTSSLTNSNSTTSNNSENLDPSNNPGKTTNPPIEESSWGNSTVGSEEESESTNSSTGSNKDPLETINDTAETVDTIIDIFK